MNTLTINQKNAGGYCIDYNRYFHSGDDGYVLTGFAGHTSVPFIILIGVFSIVLHAFKIFCCLVFRGCSHDGWVVRLEEHRFHTAVYLKDIEKKGMKS